MEEQESLLHCHVRIVSISLSVSKYSVSLGYSFGGLLYGYQQGVLGQAVVMYSFQRDFAAVRNNASKLGWLTSILQLGGWIGSLSSGVFAEVFSRRHTTFAASLALELEVSYMSSDMKDQELTSPSTEATISEAQVPDNQGWHGDFQ
jgi:hypothetical protein